MTVSVAVGDRKSRVPESVAVSETVSGVTISEASVTVTVAVRQDQGFRNHDGLGNYQRLLDDVVVGMVRQSVGSSVDPAGRSGDQASKSEALHKRFR